MTSIIVWPSHASFHDTSTCPTSREHWELVRCRKTQSILIPLSEHQHQHQHHNGNAQCTLQNIFVRICEKPIQFCVHRHSPVCRWSPARFAVVLVIYEVRSIHLSQYELNIALYYVLCAGCSPCYLSTPDHLHSRTFNGIRSSVAGTLSRKWKIGTPSIELPKKTRAE